MRTHACSSIAGHGLWRYPHASASPRECWGHPPARSHRCWGHAQWSRAPQACADPGQARHPRCDGASHSPHARAHHRHDHPHARRDPDCRDSRIDFDRHLDVENDRWRRADRAYQPAFGHRRAEHHRPDRDGIDCRPARRDDHDLHRRGEHADEPRARHGLVRPLADVSPVRPNRHVQLIQTIYQIRQAMGGGVLDVIA